MSRQTPYLMMQLGETLGNALQDRRDRSRREMFGQRLADIAQSEENPVKAMMTVQREFPDFATPDTFKMLDMVYTDKKRQQVDNLAKTVMSLKDSMQDADPKADAVGLYAQRIKEAASQYSPDVQEVAFTALKRLHEAKREPEDPLIAIDKTKDYMRRNGRGGYETVFPSVAPDIEITRHNPTNNMIESRKIRADAWERVKEQMGGQGWQEGEMKAGPSTESKAPTTRTIQRGDKNVNQEWNADTKTWIDVGGGPRSDSFGMLELAAKAAGVDLTKFKINGTPEEAERIKAKLPTNALMSLLFGDGAQPATPTVSQKTATPPAGYVDSGKTTGGKKIYINPKNPNAQAWIEE